RDAGWSRSHPPHQVSVPFCVCRPGVLEIKLLGRSLIVGELRSIFEELYEWIGMPEGLG
ncbi:MAG: hypothetical protein ACI92Z_000734, partial [Paracoccaceae bacterium]